MLRPEQLGRGRMMGVLWPFVSHCCTSRGVAEIRRNTASWCACRPALAAEAPPLQTEPRPPNFARRSQQAFTQLFEPAVTPTCRPFPSGSVHSQPCGGSSQAAVAASRVSQHINWLCQRLERQLVQTAHEERYARAPLWKMQECPVLRGRSRMVPSTCGALCCDLAAALWQYVEYCLHAAQRESSLLLFG